MKVLIVGAGGIGGHVGARLIEAGADVTFLVRERRRAQLAADGLRVVSPLGDWAAPVRTVHAAALKPGYDVAILTCKAYDLDAATKDLAAAMDGRCIVLPMLNGMAHLASLDARFGATQVWGGAIQMNVTLEPDGTVRHRGKMARLIFGERGAHKVASSTAAEFAALLARTSLDGVHAPRIEQDMWEKLVMLSALAALTCLFRATVGEINASAGGTDAVERTIATNVRVATAAGFPPREASIAFTRQLLLDPTSGLTASMLRDLEGGGQVESDHIVGFMLDHARASSLDITVLSMAYTHLKAYEARRAAGR